MARGRTETAKKYFPEAENKYAAQLEAYKIMSDEELFEVMGSRCEYKAGGHAGQANSKDSMRYVPENMFRI